MVDKFDDFVVEVKDGDKKEHNCHVDEKSKNAASDKFEKFGHYMFILNTENEAAIGKISKKNRSNPGDDIGELKLKGVLWVENSENERVVREKTNEGGKNANDEIADDLGVFSEKGFNHVWSFCDEIWWRLDGPLRA